MMMMDHHERRRLHRDDGLTMMRDVIDRIHAINNGPCELFYQPHVNGFTYTSTFDSNKNHSPWLRKQQRKQQQRRQPLRRPQKKQPLRRPLRKLRRRSKLRSIERVEGPEQSGPFAFLVVTDHTLFHCRREYRNAIHLCADDGSKAVYRTGRSIETRRIEKENDQEKSPSNAESAPLRTRFPYH